jgi:enoyl-CoA hydratase/carnithine racemase
MSIRESSPSDNGRGSGAGWRSWTDLRIDRRSPGYCRVTFDHPPANAIGATTVAELEELVGLIEEDADLNVVVFASARRDVYLSGHEDPWGTSAPPGCGPEAWTQALARLLHAPVVSVACIRGRACGAGSELVLACDLRFASREHASVGGFDLAGGASPGTAGLARLVGRSRALEVLLVAGELDAPDAERWGCVNRAIADDRLEDEVDAVATRLAAYDHAVVARAKAGVAPPR